MAKQAKQSPVLGWISGEALSQLLAALIKPLIPVLAGGVTVVSALLHEVPLWLIVPFAAIAFFGAVGGLVYLDTLWARRAYGGKLVVFDVQYVPEVNGENTELVGYTLNLIMRNHSYVDIQYTIENFSGRLGVPAIRELPNTRNMVDVLAMQDQWQPVGFIPYTTSAEVHRQGSLSIAYRYKSPKGVVWRRNTINMMLTAEIEEDGRIARSRAYRHDS